jgi:hypothetical protein
LLPVKGFCQVSGVIGVKFGFAPDANYAVTNDLFPGDAAGILVDDALAVSNWNNLLTELPLTNDINTTWSITNDSAGNLLHDVTLTPAGFDDGWYNGGTECPNGRLLYAVWKFNGNNSLIDGSGNHYATLTFSNLPASKYDVYVYINNNNNNYWGNVEANGEVAVGNGFDSAGFNGAEDDPCGTTPQLHTATGYGNPANYVAMPAVATTTGGVIVVEVGVQGGDFGVAGVELVPTGTVVHDAPPVITVPPTPLVLFPGSTANFTVSALGSVPIYYQWQMNAGSGWSNVANGGNISGATSATLTISAVAAANVASYQVVASNTAPANNVVTSAVTTLAVVASPASNSYAATAVADGALAYWALSDTAAPSNSPPTYDYVGGFNGNYGTNSQNGFEGVTGPQPPDFTGFLANNYALECASNIPDSWVTTLATPTLQTNEASFVMWIYPLGIQNGYTGLFMTRAGGSGGGAGLGYTDGDQLGYTWNNNNSDTWGFSSGLVVETNEWSMVALVISANSAVLYLYNANGLLSVANTIPHLTETWGGAATIGDDAGDGGNGGRAFYGKMDGVAMFGTALTADQIFGLYAAGKESGALPPVISSQPSPEEVLAGRTAKFEASVTGTSPLTYSWSKDSVTLTNGGNISGATNSILVISSIGASDAGSYSVTVQNPVGTTSSIPAALTLATPSTAAYPVAVSNLNPVAYWRLNETNPPYAYENWGGYTGLYDTGVGLGQPGPTPSLGFPGFETDNLCVTFTNAEPNSWVTVPALNLDTNTVTITAWINPNAIQTASSAIFFCRAGGTTAGLGFDDTGLGQLGYTWANNGATYGFLSGLTPAIGIWSFVALVIEPTQATLYLDNAEGTSASINPVTNAMQTFAGPSEIGNDAYDSTGGTRTFEGLIDEVTVFNQALSASQIAALYTAGSGALVPITIAEQPQGTAAYASNSVQFTVDASGSGPIYYQWELNGINIAGATTSVLNITNVQSINAGTYTVVISNSISTNVTDGTATLAVGEVNCAYERAVLALNPIAYYRLNEPAGSANLYDYVGGHDGVYEANAISGAWGVTNPPYFGFETGNLCLETITNAADDSWATAPFGTLGIPNVTFTCWINPIGDQNDWAGLIVDRTGAQGGLGYNASQMLSYTWNNNSTWDFNSYLYIPTNTWSFCAMVIAPNAAHLYLYNTNGLGTAVNPIPHTPDAFGNSWHLGNDAAGDPGRTFNGFIDEVAIFPSSLTAAQIDDLYATATGRPLVDIAIATSGTNVVLTWPQGSLLQATSLTGPWTTNTGATSPYKLSPTEQQQYFKLSIPAE